MPLAEALEHIGHRHHQAHAAAAVAIYGRLLDLHDFRFFLIDRGLPGAQFVVGDDDSDVLASGEIGPVVLGEGRPITAEQCQGERVSLCVVDPCRDSTRLYKSDVLPALPR